MKSGVYILRDPINGLVRYVGQSVDVKKRLVQHWASRKYNNRLSRWLEEIDLQGLRPLVVVLPVAKDRLDAVEGHFIDAHWETSFNGKNSGGGFRDGVLVGAKRTCTGVFYGHRDQWIRKMRAKLVAKGVPVWKTNSSANGGISWDLLKRGCAYALRKMQNDYNWKFAVANCYLKDGFLLVFPDADSDRINLDGD